LLKLIWLVRYPPVLAEIVAAVIQMTVQLAIRY
jgi:hypothetical protein